MQSYVMCPKKWLKDEDVLECMSCGLGFSFLRRRHHCRNCCGIFCNECSSNKIALLSLKLSTPQRVCDACHSQLKAVNEATASPKSPQSEPDMEELSINFVIAKPAS
mmetsp:Transcript_23576/g.32999  ORF Transcript_23576/g.32999 Transcript_23576/m.32999 type:complete len:107 (-) Transcript_23576:380-700(-)